MSGLKCDPRNHLHLKNKSMINLNMTLEKNHKDITDH